MWMLVVSCLCRLFKGGRDKIDVGVWNYEKKGIIYKNNIDDNHITNT